MIRVLFKIIFKYFKYAFYAVHETICLMRLMNNYSLAIMHTKVNKSSDRHKHIID